MCQLIGNKFGEPVVTGFARSYGQQIRYEYTHPRSSSRTSENENQNEEPLKHTQVQRVEWLKPVMFTAGVGLLDDQHCSKGAPEPGMLVCKIGGPAYRIGKFGTVVPIGQCTVAGKFSIFSIIKLTVGRMIFYCLY